MRKGFRNSCASDNDRLATLTLPGLLSNLKLGKPTSLSPSSTWQHIAQTVMPMKGTESRQALSLLWFLGAGMFWTGAQKEETNKSTVVSLHWKDEKVSTMKGQWLENIQARLKHTGRRQNIFTKPKVLWELRPCNLTYVQQKTGGREWLGPRLNKWWTLSKCDINYHSRNSGKLVSHSD